MAEYFITAKIVFETALHVGSGKGNEPTDAPIRRGHDGRILIPGSGIAGSLRSTATRLAPRLGFTKCQSLLKESEQDKNKPCACTACQLFGDVNPVEKPANKNWPEANASRLWIYDAFTNKDSATFVRDGVGIDRKYGHAVEHAKFDLEIVPRGTEFNLSMRLFYSGLDHVIEENIKLLLTATLAEWVNGRGQLGGNVSRGLGQFQLEDLTYAQPNFKTSNDLIDYLKAQDRVKACQPDTKWHETYLAKARASLKERKKSGRSQTVAGSFIKLSFDLNFDELFLQNDPLVAMLSGFDHAPLIEKLEDDGFGNPVLAGSSIRGVLRHQAGKIIRTLYTHYCLENEPQPAQAFLVNCPSCSVLEDERGEALASCVSRPHSKKNEDKHHEWQEKDFCLTCQLFGNQERGSRLLIQDAVWQKEGSVHWQAQDFLAIDRFTGGGLDGAKFDAAPLSKAKFRTTITLQDPAQWELGLLALLIRDLAEKQITIGFGAAKGYGRVQAQNCQWEVGYITKSDLEEENMDLFSTLNTDASGIYTVAIAQAEDWLPTKLQSLAEEWVLHFNKVVNTFNKSEFLDSLLVDTFFDKEDGTGLSATGQLYGRSRAEILA